MGDNMNLDIKKEVSIEYIENTYALGANYLKKNNSLELKHLLNELELIEDKIHRCSDIEFLKRYKVILNQLINKIEVIVNE